MLSAINSAVMQIARVALLFVLHVLYDPYKHSPLYRMIETIISLFGYNDITRTEKLFMARLAGEFLSLILHKIFGRIKQVFLV